MTSSNTEQEIKKVSSLDLPCCKTKVNGEYIVQVMFSLL